MNRFNTADEVVAYIEQRKNRGYGLKHFQQYLKTLYDPQKKLKTIHIAGTNGKGSTTNDICSVLQEAGYQVGMFTSPYMITHYDRIRINQQNISEEVFLKFANMYYDAWMEWDLSMFEIDMCIACLWFLEANVDFAVFEVGLGGRKDPTNVIEPLVSVITNIGMDHMEYLGDSFEEIANEKAGIIKPYTDVITAEEKDVCIAVFEAKARACQSRCIHIQEIKNVQKHGYMTFNYRDMEDIVLSSDARYQCKNAALAIETLLYLRQKEDVFFHENQLRAGLRKAVWIGRFEVVSQKPYIILDGAHNVEGILALCDALQDIENPVILFSVLRDKNFEAMLWNLQSISNKVIVCQSHNDRALDVHALHNRDGIQVIDDAQEAMRYAVTLDRTIVVTGSLYFISEVRKNIIKKARKF